MTRAPMWNCMVRRSRTVSIVGDEQQPAISQGRNRGGVDLAAGDCPRRHAGEILGDYGNVPGLIVGQVDISGARGGDRGAPDVEVGGVRAESRNVVEKEAIS